MESHFTHWTFRIAGYLGERNVSPRPVFPPPFARSGNRHRLVTAAQRRRGHLRGNGLADCGEKGYPMGWVDSAVEWDERCEVLAPAVAG